ncbi:unnamed protein product [Owenia fusiformis]|uniref:Uncharacterized protein n=1 Tax=Owenia fusiformis TaxID=6347 RepID=A0A8J1UGX1_OWEFU|nr:unnamed protein product [Owenia fusiformis]
MMANSLKDMDGLPSRLENLGIQDGQPTLESQDNGVNRPPTPESPGGTEYNDFRRKSQIDLENIPDVHQFYPEIKGTYGKMAVQSPIDEDRPESAFTDITVDIHDDDNEYLEKVSEVDEDRAMSGSIDPKAAQQKFSDHQIVEYREADGATGGEGEPRQSLDEKGNEEGVFSTAVDEDMIRLAKERMKERTDGSVFATESWTETAKEGITLQKIVDARRQEHYEKALKLMNDKEYVRAIRTLNKAISLNHGHVDYYIQRAECFIQLCDFQSAILNYKHACVLEPENMDYYSRLSFIYYFQGQCLFDQKMYSEALEAFSRAAEMSPEVSGYHTRSIACLAALERHGECLALVNKRLEAEQDNPDLFIMRARLHELFRNRTLCYYDVKDALALNPQHPEAINLMKMLDERAKDHRQQALQLSLLGKPREALQKISVAIETNPSIAGLHVLRGSLHRKLQDYNAAIDDYLLALDKTDHDEESSTYQESQRQLLLTYNDFAVECFTKGFYEEAIILLNKAIKGEKREKGLYVNRGDCFFKQGEPHFSLQDYHQALEMDPSDQGVRARVAIVHNEFGIIEYADKNYPEADSRFTLAIQNNPSVGRYYVSRARARYMMENGSGARDDILLALHLDPDNKEIFGIMSRLYPGKTTSDVIRSPAAEKARRQLQNLVTTASPVRLKSLDSQSVTWNQEASVADYKVCLNEEELVLELVNEKRKVHKQLKEKYLNRKTLKHDGARVTALPPARPYKVQGNPVTKQEVVVDAPKGVGKSTGWRTFSLGIGLR